MMRSDMPKQVMAYRNGGGIPSLATVPMSTEIRGEPHQLSYITPFEAEMLRGMGGSGAPGPGGIPQYAGVYETLFGKPFSDTAVGQALGMNNPPKYLDPPDAALPPSQRSKQSLGRRIKEQRREAAAALEQSGSTATSGAQSYTDANKSIFDPATNTYTTADGTVIGPSQTAVNQTGFMSDEDLVTLGGMQVNNDADTQAAVVDQLIESDSLDNFVAVNTAAGNDLSYIDNLNAITSVSTPGGTSVSTPGVTSVASPGVNIASPTTYTMAPMAAVPDFTGYAPIVPSVASADGIMGLNSGQGSPFVYTAYMPEAYTPATGSLVLPPLG